jgi:hypothetical protein
MLAQKKAQLKAAIKSLKRSADNGRHTWGDFYLKQNISTLRKEIQILSKR